MRLVRKPERVALGGGRAVDEGLLHREAVRAAPPGVEQVELAERAGLVRVGADARREQDVVHATARAQRVARRIAEPREERVEVAAARA